jgi:hypothetical protein
VFYASPNRTRAHPESQVTGPTAVCCGSRHDLSAPGGTAGENIMAMHQVRTWRRDQGRDTLNELQRRERHPRRAVSRRTLEGHPDEAGWCLRPSGSSQSRASQNPAQAFAASSVSTADGHPAVQGVVAPGSAPERERLRAPPMNLEPTRTSITRDRGPPLYRGRLHQQ